MPVAWFMRRFLRPFTARLTGTLSVLQKVETGHGRWPRSARGLLV